MATGRKTVIYAFPTLASAANNTLTSFATRTIWLEAGTKTFRSVKATLTFDDIVTATGGTITTKTRGFRLNAVAYTDVTNTGTLTNSGENLSGILTTDMTSMFQTNFGAGASATLDFRFQINQSTGTTLGMVNCSLTVEIDYEYDDTQATHVKTVLIPLNAPVAAVTTGAVTYDTFPALDTFLEETGKTIRDIAIVFEGNEGRNAAVTDSTLTIAVGATTVTTGNYEGALASDRRIRYVFDLTAAGFTATNTTHNFQLTSSVARFNHPIAYAIVTYEFDPASTRHTQSVMLPFMMEGLIGFPTNADYNRARVLLPIAEPGVITTKRLAALIHWPGTGTITGLNYRLGTGTFVAYTDVATNTSGEQCAMVRNDAAYTLARGDNTLEVGAFCAMNPAWPAGIGGYILAVYSSDRATGGPSTHLQTRRQSLISTASITALAAHTSAATGFTIPEAEYRLASVGVRFQPLLTSSMLGVGVVAELLSAEGGSDWRAAIQNVANADAEVGYYQFHGDASKLFKRWANDPSTNVMDVETARRWRCYCGAILAFFPDLDLLVTYHSITFTTTLTVTDSAGGTVNIEVFRADTDEKLLATSRVGNGTVNVTWHDDTLAVYAVARETDVLLTRSADFNFGD